VHVVRETISQIEVLRGASCGATWDAALRVVGLPCVEAVARIGLETQFFCRADPSAWDPIHGKSPVHFAAEVHKAALQRALRGRWDTHL
jgi:thymidylate synthase